MEVLGRSGVPGEREQAFDALLSALESSDDAPSTVRDRSAALGRHVADSLSGLAVERLRFARTVADIGAGAGFPGLPLALALPQARVDLLESRARSADVIERFARAAGASNAHAVTARAEEWAAAAGAGAYDVVTARAVAALAVVAEYAAPLLRVGGALVAWKGARDAEEEAAGDAASARLGLELRTVHVVVPFAGARRRHLHVFEKVAPTPAGFPRRAGMARKRPLG